MWGTWSNRARREQVTSRSVRDTYNGGLALDGGTDDETVSIGSADRRVDCQGGAAPSQHAGADRKREPRFAGGAGGGGDGAYENTPPGQLRNPPLPPTTLILS